MAWSTAGSTAKGTAATLACTNTTVGDVRAVWTGSSSATPVVSGGGVTTWNTLIAYHGTQTGVFVTIVWGLVTATGSQTLSMTHTPFETTTQEFVPPAGTPAADTSGTLSGTTTGTVAGVSVTPTAAGELWLGYNVNAASTGAGNTTGVVYTVTSTNNQIGWDLNSPSGAFAPNWGNTGAWDTLAGFLTVSGAAPAFAPRGLVVPQARNRLAVF